MLIADKLVISHNKRRLLDELSLTANPGELHVVLGPNGAGKSTLIRALSGLVSLDSGTVLLQARGLEDYSVSERSLKLAVLLQEQWLDFPFSVHDVVSMGQSPILFNNSSINPERADRRQASKPLSIDEALAIFDLEGLRHADYTSLSGGEQQRVHLARLFMQINPHTETVILDEPLKAIDLSHQFVVMKELKALTQQGMAVIVVLHDLSLCARFADQVTLLKQGAVVKTGGVDEVMESNLLSEVFDAKIQQIEGDNSPLFYVAG